MQMVCQLKLKENKKGEIYSPLIFYKEGDIWKKN